jgi:AraC-like DNA-binding protein
MNAMGVTPGHAPARALRHARAAGGPNIARLRPAEPVVSAAAEPSLKDMTLAGPGSIALRGLARRIAHHAPRDGVFPLRVPGTYVLRRGRPTAEPVRATLGPCLCIVAQGAKVMMLGSEVLEYDPERMLVFTVDLPVSGQLSRATWREPFLGFRLDLDPARVADLAARVYPLGIPKAETGRGIFVGQSSEAIVEAVTRLVDLMVQPQDADLLGPLVVDEILIRLLRSPIGPRVAQIAEPRSSVHRVAKAVSWMRAHFAQPVTVEEMAASAGMSASSFHQHFKTVTSMSPLQYQKVLRLHEARRLMLFQHMDVSEAGHRVGYLSASQFTREYGRFFGNAPTRDIARLREQGFGPASGGRDREQS